LGLSTSLIAGACVNFSCAGAAWIVAREEGWKSGPDTEAKSKSPVQPVEYDRFLLLIYGVTGFCGLALELLWTRALILLLNNTTYAFSLVLSVFLLGTAAGAAIASRLKPAKREDAFLLLGAMMAGVGVLSLGSAVALAFNQPVMELLSGAPGKGWLAAAIPGGKPMASALVFALLVITPCTALLGACFPLAAGLYLTGNEKAGGDLGRLYAVNVAGCVLGSLTAGYFLVPILGIRSSMILLAALAAGAGILLAFRRAAGEASKLAWATGAAALPFLVYIGLTPDVAYLLSVQKLDQGAEVEYYEEGPSATVLVSRNDTDLSVGRKPIKRIWINGDPIAGTFREALQLERLQAHIPLLLHPAPKTGLVICFGTGATAGAALLHGLDSVIAVDISKEVFNAGPYFSDGNLGVSSSPKLVMVEEDGRNYLKTTRRKFDFISTEPPPPSNAGIVSLYTEEFYRLAKGRLAPGGVLSQWIPLHHLSEEDFKSLVAAFKAVFPKGAMWYTKWDAIMIGAEDGGELDYRLLHGAFEIPAVAGSLNEIGIYDTFQLLSNHMMGPGALSKYVENIPPLVDDEPVVEFSAPRLGEDGVKVKGSNLAGMLLFRRPPKMANAIESQQDALLRAFDSQTEFFHGQVAKSEGARGQAAEHFENALNINSGNSEAEYALLSLNLETLFGAMETADPALILKMLERTEALDRRGLFTPQIKFLKGTLLSKTGESYLAERELSEAVRLDGEYMMAVASLGGLYASKLGRPRKAMEMYKKALALNPSKEERRALEEAINMLSQQ
ncbi:MAG: hypothetical protein OEZ04_11475, partial [Nitrospinota bacterium]|nr:hypothetical protein [Nitrospinota bacterium]